MTNSVIQDHRFQHLIKLLKTSVDKRPPHKRSDKTKDLILFHLTHSNKKLSSWLKLEQMAEKVQTFNFFLEIKRLNKTLVEFYVKDQCENMVYKLVCLTPDESKMIVNENQLFDVDIDEIQMLYQYD